MVIRVEEVDTCTAPDDLLREIHELHISSDEEMLPGDPPISFERRAADLRQVRSDYSIPQWLLRVDGEVVALAKAWIGLEQNVENGSGWIYVLAEHRGRGHARTLATVLLDRLEDMGRKRIDTFVVEGDPAEALCERAGLKPAYREKRSRLKVTDIDMALMRSWVERASERAADYQLLELEAPFPDDVVEAYCELQFQMNTAPLEDFEEDDEVLEPRIWREVEQRMAASGYQLLTHIAVHRPTGEFAGSTTVRTDRLQPEQAWQWETVVHPDHRNKGLGRLLKASMIERIVRDWPKVERIDTYNAGSNQPMLAINVAMGFRPIQLINAHQGQLRTARENLQI